MFLKTFLKMLLRWRNWIPKHPSPAFFLLNLLILMILLFLSSFFIPTKYFVVMSSLNVWMVTNWMMDFVSVPQWSLLGDSADGSAWVNSHHASTHAAWALDLHIQPTLLALPLAAVPRHCSKKCWKVLSQMTPDDTRCQWSKCDGQDDQDVTPMPLHWKCSNGALDPPRCATMPWTRGEIRKRLQFDPKAFMTPECNVITPECNEITLYL